MNNYNCIVVLGPTAGGKTRLACQLAYALDGEIISADSRQVYKHLDIGTGKDLEEYRVNEKEIAFHLINIFEPQQQFYLHQFTEELKKSFELIRSKKKTPIICGGTGLYLDALRKDFSFTQIKENEKLRSELESVSKEELIARIKTYPEQFIQHVDLHSKKRIIRGIEIAAHFSKEGNTLIETILPYKPYYIGIDVDVELRKKQISERLTVRLNQGLIEEVETLLSQGITHERLNLFGLEYKFVSKYLQNQISKEELFTQLETAIFQFSKRQMTWFRKMEKEGVKINWIQKDKDVLPQLIELFK
jgi:tRNA dimethylallyltransferase